MSLHSGHRERLKKRFLEEGLDAFEPHVVLELLLFFAVPRVDTNETAHRLLSAFGSLRGVLDASHEQLGEIKGVGSNAACLLKMIAPLSRRYLSEESGPVFLNTTEQAGNFLLPRFIGRTNETVILITLDSKCKVLATPAVFEGNVNSVAVNIRKIVESSLRHNASGVIIAHNHPGGVALPSNDDLATTAKIASALRLLNMVLIDHIIVADNDFVSLADSGFIKKN